MDKEERAKKTIREFKPITSEYQIEDALICMANEQQDIDIEKTCEWIKETIPSGLGQFSVEDIIKSYKQAVKN